MELYANEGKELYLQVGDKTYARHAIQTHFIGIGEDYVELVRKYVAPIYQEGDILSTSEKIVALCQGRVVKEEEVKPGLLARILCKFVHQTAAGPGMGTPIKMQFAINEVGGLKILWYAIRAAFDKLRGIKGTFYRLAGPEVTGLDGFYGHDIEEYAHMGIRIPADPGGVCDRVFEETGIKSMIVDANAISVDVLGKTHQLDEIADETLVAMIRDNPAGQMKQLTPFILVREVSPAAEPTEISG